MAKDSIRLIVNSLRSDADPFGFYQSKEGRDFLRFCYNSYRDALGQSHGKVGLIVAERIISGSSEEAQNDEDAKTASALRRWLEDGQGELWAGDIGKSIRVLQKLEELLMSERRIREIMEDRAAQIRKKDFFGAISSFFYMPTSPRRRAILRQMLKQHTGVFSIWERGESERHSLYYYETSNFCIKKIHDELPILAVQEFELLPDGITAAKRRSGFMFVSESGTILRFMISLRNPRARWIEFVNEMRVDRDDLSHIPITHILYSSTPFSNKSD